MCRERARASASVTANAHLHDNAVHRARKRTRAHADTSTGPAVAAWSAIPIKATDSTGLRTVVIVGYIGATCLSLRA